MLIFLPHTIGIGSLLLFVGSQITLRGVLLDELVMLGGRVRRDAITVALLPQIAAPVR